MKTWKQGISALLSALMLLPALPTAWAAEEPVEQREIQNNSGYYESADEGRAWDESGSGGMEATGSGEDGNAPVQDEEQFEMPDYGKNEQPAVIEISEGEAAFNLEDMPITVGNDTAKAEDGSQPYMLFNEDGNFTIDLDEFWQGELFFPFEVQFTYGGVTTEEWFMDPGDTVDIGGHVFSLHTTKTEDGIRQIGAWAGDTYIPAYPEKKEFSNEPKMSTMSLLPLEEKEVYLDLKDAVLPMESRIKLSTIMDESAKKGTAISVDGGAVVWVTEKDKYVYTLNPDTVMIDVGYHSTNLELITNTVDQLNTDNIRYLVHISRYNGANDALQCAVTSGGEPVESSSSFGLNYSIDDTENIDSVNYWPVYAAKTNDIRLGLSLKEPYNAQEGTQEGLAQIKIYKSNYSAIHQMKDPYMLPEEVDDVTSTLWSEDAKYKYSDDYDSVFLMQIMRNGECTGMVRFVIYVERERLLYPENLTYFRESGSDWQKVANENYRWREYNTDNGVIRYIHIMEHTQNTNMDLAVRFMPAEISYDDVEKVVEGHYDTAEAVRNSGKQDISDKLLCKTSFNNDKETPNWYTGVFDVEKPFTLLTKSGRIFKFSILAEGSTSGDSIGYRGLYNSNGIDVAMREDSSSRDGVTDITAYVASINSDYRILLQYDEENIQTHNINSLTGSAAKAKVEKAVEGTYATLNEASSQTDIKDKLFADSGADGYPISSTNTQFTVFGTNKKVYHVNVSLSWSANTLFTANGFESVENADNSTTYYSVYNVSRNDDSYYENGYQTLLVLKDVPGSPYTSQEPVTPDEMKNMKLTFTLGKGVQVFAGDGSTEQTSGVSVQDYSNGTIQYAASADDKKHMRNYFVTAKTQESGPRLFVNGPQDRREVFLVDAYENKHDIFIANTGSEALTGLKVELTDAKNVKLDDYWTIGETNTLAPFTTTRSKTYTGQTTYGNYLPNIAKIRLVTPEGESGSVAGKLTISADNVEPVSIVLTGLAGDPKITSDSVPQGVKYVVYNAMLFNDNLYDWITPVFKVTKGKLPKGVSLGENGQIYGVPTEKGTFNFTVQADFNVKQNQAISVIGKEITFPSDTASFTMEILDDTKENVEGKLGVDKGYELTTRLEDYIEENYEDRTFVSKGEYIEFTKFATEVYLDGKLLTENVDYTHEPGSTKITLKKATAQNAGTGSHTITARFNKGGSRYNVQRVSQKYNSTPKKSSGGSSNRPSGGGSSSRPSSGGSSSRPSSGGSSSRPSGGGGGGGSTANTPAKPATPPAPVQHEVITPKAERGSVTLDPPKAKKGDTVTVTTVPDKNFQIISVSIKDKDGKPVPVTKAGENKYSFVMPDSQVTVNTVFATINPEVSPEERDERTPFTDVSKNKWYAESIAYVYEKGLMQGTSANSFEPNSTTSRSMMVTTLYRMAGEPETTGESFPDVPADTWYSKAASWAKQTGVFTGYPDGRLGVNDDIAREQVVSVLMRYAEMQGIDVSATKELDGFKDSGMISPYAQKAFGWAVETGIIMGDNKGFLNPRGNATRAEIATILMRADQKFDGEINKMNADDNKDGSDDKADANDEKADSDDKADTNDKSGTNDKAGSKDNTNSDSNTENRGNDPEK